MQIHVSHRNLTFERCNETERLVEKNEPERCNKTSTVVDSLPRSYHTIMAGSPDREATGNDCLECSSTHEQNSHMIFSTNDTKSAGEMLLGAESSAREVSFPEGYVNGNSVNQPDVTSCDISSEDVLTMENAEDSTYYDCRITRDNRPSQGADEHGGNFDSFSWISTDGYSTEGTVGSRSFGDRDDDIIDRLLVDNVDDFGINYGRLNDVPKSSLTPLNLEILNTAGELDKHECVRSYVQAWSPLNLPTAATYSNSLPGACVDLALEDKAQTSPEYYDRFQSEHEVERSTPNEQRDLDEVDSQEFCLFYQREHGPGFRSPSNNWNLLKNDRAPWINTESEGVDKMVGGREGSLGDIEDSDWPRGMADTWQDSNKGLTICSLSTIHEESDDADKIAQDF
ncbi:uncharacterized protein LOC114522272 isoform X1 [Dendronephthya gigantea]|uniref:uncharacterized protein LOC114522272 isoform X1 n=1 Tax=Dendronephthya gigantea TaxID=151771 RepID=UPI00106A52D6|nr:uncharacterized protein LOC114522272 isoform X1 [Dendronephthya gigantea]